MKGWDQKNNYEQYLVAMAARHTLNQNYRLRSEIVTKES